MPQDGETLPSLRDYSPPRVLKNRRSRTFTVSVIGSFLVFGLISSFAVFNNASIEDDAHETLIQVRRKLSAAMETVGGFPAILPESEDAVTTTSRELTDDDSLSSCIMVMDDNHLLVEWIAYHYFVMNMRYLVVLPDPQSRFSPKPVLDRWRDKMTIVEWTYEDYMEEDHLDEAMAFLNSTNSTPEDAQVYHNKRQNEFLRKCAMHMKDHDRKWVSFHDVDEYYVINEDAVRDASKKMQEMGGGMKLLNDLQLQIVSLLNFLKQAGNGTSSLIPAPLQYVGPCVTTYRTPYGAIESSKHLRNMNVPEFLDARRFETLRWRHHEPHTHPQDGKALLDVSRIDIDVLNSTESFLRPHELIPTCPDIFYHDNAFLRINHYVGNWEYYSFRKNDGRQGARKNRRKWGRESMVHGGTSGDEARPWITGFVRHFGQEQAVGLLKDCGLDPDIKVLVTPNWMKEEDRKKYEEKKVLKAALLKEREAEAIRRAPIEKQLQKQREERAEAKRLRQEAKALLRQEEKAANEALGYVANMHTVQTKTLNATLTAGKKLLRKTNAEKKKKSKVIEDVDVVEAESGALETITATEGDASEIATNATTKGKKSKAKKKKKPKATKSEDVDVVEAESGAPETITATEDDASEIATNKGKKSKAKKNKKSKATKSEDVDVVDGDGGAPETITATEDNESENSAANSVNTNVVTNATEDATIEEAADGKEDTPNEDKGSKETENEPADSREKDARTDEENSLENTEPEDETTQDAEVTEENASGNSATKDAEDTAEADATEEDTSDTAAKDAADAVEEDATEEDTSDIEAKDA